MSLNNVSPGMTYVELVPVLKTANAADDAWHDWDLSGSIPATAIAATISCMSIGSPNQGIRKDGSALARIILGAYNVFVVDVAASRTIEYYDSSVATTAYNLTGYFI